MLATCLAVLALHSTGAGAHPAGAAPTPPPTPGTADPVPTVTAPHSTAHGDAILVKAAKLIVKPGVVLENTSVLVHDGIIEAVGADLEAPEGARVVEGSVVCAGFLDPWGTAGLAGSSVSDQATTASTRSVDGLDPFGSKDVRADILASGVTAIRVQAGMRSRVGGIGAVVRTADGGPGGAILGDACVNATVGVSRGGRAMDIVDRVGEADRVASIVESGRSYLENHIEYKYDLEEWAKAIADKEEELEKDFKKAKKDRDKEIEKAKEKDKEFKEERYKEDKKPKAPKYNADDEVMGQVANGDLPLVVEVHGVQELRKLLRVTAKFDRLRMIVAGGTESLLLADQLAARRIPVIVYPSPRASGREYANADLGLAGQLHERGVQVLIGSGGAAASGSRDLSLFAALAVAHGLDRDAAFAALTLGAANALDVGDRLGSVERGKDAELVVLDGDPLSSTSRVQYVISGGEVVVEP